MNCPHHPEEAHAARDRALGVVAVRRTYELAFGASRFSVASSPNLWGDDLRSMAIGFRLLEAYEVSCVTVPVYDVEALTLEVW